MKTLSSPHSAALNNTITQPGYLIRVGFSTPYYLSTLGDISWNSLSWMGYDVRVSGNTQDGRGRSNLKLDISNHNDEWGALVLTHGIADVPIQVWGFDGAATALDDVEPIFDGVGDSCEIGETKVTIQCVSQGTFFAQSPRRFVSPATGFNYLSPDGKKIRFGDTTVILERK